MYVIDETMNPLIANVPCSFHLCFDCNIIMFFFIFLCNVLLYLFQMKWLKVCFEGCKVGII